MVRRETTVSICEQLLTNRKIKAITTNILVVISKTTVKGAIVKGNEPKTSGYTRIDYTGP